MRMGTTEHTERNFDPANYEIVDYFDNKRPSYWGQEIEVWKAEIEEWKERFRRVYGKDWIRKIHRCEHCHNTNVRYIIAVRDKRTGEVITFGDTCIAKLNFNNLEEYKVAQVRANANIERKNMRVWLLYKQYLKDNPKVGWAVKEINKEIHSGNRFAHDVMGKLKKYGSLTDKQRDVLIKSLKYDYIREEEKKNKPISNYIGEPGKRLEVDVEVYKIIKLHNKYIAYFDYGFSSINEVKLHLMRDINGNEIRWFAKGTLCFKEGDRIRIRGTVIKHNVYKKTKQTILSRVKEVVLYDMDLRKRGVI